MNRGMNELLALVVGKRWRSWANARGYDTAPSLSRVERKEKRPPEKVLSRRPRGFRDASGHDFSPLDSAHDGGGIKHGGHGGGFESGRFRRIDPVSGAVRFGERDDAAALTVVAGPLHADTGAEREKGKQRAFQEASAEADGTDLKAQDDFSLSCCGSETKIGTGTNGRYPDTFWRRGQFRRAARKVLG